MPNKDRTMDATELTANFRAARAALISHPGRPFAASRKALTALTDEWLEGLWRLAGGPDAGTSLIAVGGHGRGELSPGSDVDLLLLSRNPDVGQVAERIWYPIWDSGIKLDHSTRTLPEARRMAAQDIRVVLGLLDARVICGDAMAGQALRSSILADWRALAPKRLDELRLMVEQRTETFGTRSLA
jgi:[protein-PII] uridylyltransferase